jgi:hypothetical protein
MAMPKRTGLMFLMLLAWPVAAQGGQFQKEIKGRWLGAWVVLRTESTSDCGGRYTNNRVSGELVRGQGAHRFQPGELGKVDKIDLKKARLDVLLTLSEKLLSPYREGPFTLYAERTCKVELEVTLPREVVKSRNMDAVEQALTLVLERHATLDRARQSDTWNEREMEPYPEDYQRTLAELEVWRAEQRNAQVEGQRSKAMQEIFRLTERIDRDAEYLAGFADGVEYARSQPLDECDELISHEIDQYRKRQAGKTGQGAAQERGYEDGQLLVHGLTMIRELPGCLVPVPELPPEPPAGE